MAYNKHKEWILETIDQLRQRKARPDFERISHMLQRKHGVKPAETQASVEKLVEEEIILKVDYKGSTSYRNAAKWSHGHVGGQVINSNAASTRILNAVRELTKDGQRESASASEIEKWLISKSPDTRLVKNRLQVAIQRELGAKTIEKLSDGTFVINKNTSKKNEVKSKEETTPSSIPEQPPSEAEPVKPQPVVNNSKSPVPLSVSKRGRPPSKRKRIKKTHGPDFETPQGRNGEDSKCDYCLLSAETNRHGKQENLLTCKDCNAKAHPSCMEYSEELAQRARVSPWQCIDCKTCYVCDDSGDAVTMLFCDACDKGYHMTCHNPPISEKPTGKWECGICQREKTKPAEDNTEPGPANARQRKGKGQTSKYKEMESHAESDNNDEIDEEDPSTALAKGIRKRRMRKNQKAFWAKKKRRGSFHSVSSQDHSLNTPSVEDFPINGFTENIGGASCLPTPSASPTPGDIDDSDSTGKPGADCVRGSLTCDTRNEMYPDASNWTISDVAEYFEKCGFKEQAEAFRTQEIDGQSLLLMKRNDVLTGLDIRLGPALKIYQKVMSLQTAGQTLS